MQISKQRLIQIIKEELAIKPDGEHDAAESLARYLGEGGLKSGDRISLPKHIAANGRGEIFTVNDDGTYEVHVAVRHGRKQVTVSAEDILDEANEGGEVAAVQEEEELTSRESLEEMITKQLKEMTKK